MSPASSPLCWRKCGQVRTQLHIWCSWPLVSSFWFTVTDPFVELTNYSLTLSPELTILDISLTSFPHHFQTIVHHMFLAARTTIAKHWKEPVSPP